MKNDVERIFWALVNMRELLKDICHGNTWRSYQYSP